MAKDLFTKTLDSAEVTIKELEADIDTTFKPMRRSVLRRFPSLFLLLVTFGVAATMFGFERLLMDITWLNERPLVMLSIGVFTLVATGRLYKKLG